MREISAIADYDQIIEFEQEGKDLFIRKMSCTCKHTEVQIARHGNWKKWDQPCWHLKSALVLARKRVGKKDGIQTGRKKEQQISN